MTVKKQENLYLNCNLSQMSIVMWQLSTQLSCGIFFIKKYFFVCKQYISHVIYNLWSLTRREILLNNVLILKEILKDIAVNISRHVIRCFHELLHQWLLTVNPQIYCFFLRKKSNLNFIIVSLIPFILKTREMVLWKFVFEFFFS